MRIVVLGYIVRGPIGGMAWHHLQYVLGLVRLGHDVRFVEDSDDYPSCYDPSRHVVDSDPSYGLGFASDAFSRLGIPNLWAYYDAHTSTWLGPSSTEAGEFCETADIAFNLSGVNPLREWTSRIPVRVLVDTDPVFTQVRHLTDDKAVQRASHHNAYFTFAENVARGTARLPDDGFQWRATRQPVVLDAWTPTPAPDGASFTTVMQWQSYPAVEHNGIRYGAKAESFDAFVDLPRQTRASLEIAVGGADAPRGMLNQRGWKLQNPLDVARTTESFQDYLRGSRGELSVAKQGYVISNSGWFSERSTGYLASGRPVIAQETGYSEWLPVGRGLFCFRDADEALIALDEIERDYDRNSREARRIAEVHFDSRDVLSRLVDESMIAASSAASPRARPAMAVEGDSP